MSMTNGDKFKEVFGFGADGSRVIAVNEIWWDCEFQNRKPATNADKIREMTDEELAELLDQTYFNGMVVGKNSRHSVDIKYWLKWLKEE